MPIYLVPPNTPGVGKRTEQAINSLKCFVYATLMQGKHLGFFIDKRKVGNFWSQLDAQFWTRASFQFILYSVLRYTIWREVQNSGLGAGAGGIRDVSEHMLS